MKFSERQGIVKVRNVVQSDGMDDALRNSLWNAVQIVVFSELDGHQWVNSEPNFKLIRLLWLHFFKRPLDELRGYWPGEKETLRKWFFAAAWHEVYDFAEFIADVLAAPQKQRYIELANSYLERELSAFRFVNETLTRVTREAEIQAIQQAISDGRKVPGVEAHLGEALAKLGDRANPDYRNSIKESISAVEAMCQVVAGEPGATLGAAVKRLRSVNVDIHPALEKAWLSLYGYTNDRGGIRHAMLDESTLTQADAKYMLVSCSALVSYLVEIAGRAGIKLSSA